MNVLMNYDEFVSRHSILSKYGSLIDTKIKYGMKFTDEEPIKDLIMQVEENNKINQLRNNMKTLGIRVTPYELSLSPRLEGSFLL